MARPGWYDDPSGARGTQRWWDGQRWTPRTRAPLPRPPRLAGIVAAPALLLALVVAVWAMTRPGPVEHAAPAPAPTPSASTPLPSPTGLSTREIVASGACPDSGGGRAPVFSGGRGVGGGLSYASPNWSRDKGYRLSFTHQVTSEYKRVRDNWSTHVAVGALRRADGFTSVEAGAKALFDCSAISANYRGLQDRKILSSNATTIDGRPAHRLVGEALVGSFLVQGDRFTIVVVDTGDPKTWGFFLVTATIAIPDTHREADRLEKTLEVGR